MRGVVGLTGKGVGSEAVDVDVRREAGETKVAGAGQSSVDS